ncbi:MAG: WD40 repeat domain-containing protein [Spirochaetaceae bacterium]
MRRRTAFALVLLLVSTLHAEGVLLRTSHVDTVSAMVYDEDRDHLITGGVDGKVKLWDLEEDSLRASTQISNLAILDVALHPSRPEVALVESDENRRYRLTVWNWESGEIRYTHNLDSQPLHLAYSPRGSYLVVSTASFQSMNIFDARTGRKENLLPRGFGIVSYFAVAGSEARIMTYSATSGEIIYWDLQSGFEIQRSESEPGLEQMTLLANRRYAVALRNRTLFLVDVLGGQAVDRADLGVSPVDLGLEAGGEAVSLLVREGSGEPGLRSFALRNGRLNRRFSTTDREIPEGVSLIRYVDGELFLARRDGSIYRYGRFQRTPELFASNIIRPVTDIAPGDGQLLIASRDRLLTLTSDLFSSRDAEISAVEQLNDAYTPLPFSRGARITQAPDGTTYLWSEGDRSNIYRLGRFASPISLPVDLQGRPVSVTARIPDRLVVSYRDGSVSIIDANLGAEIYSAQALGIETAIETESHGLLIGKGVTGRLDSALLKIDPRTGESVPIDSELFLIYRLGYDDREGTLYVIGLRRDNEGGVETVLQMYSGSQLQRRRTLYTVAGEFLNADLAVDSNDGEIFTTLGEVGVRRYDGRRFEELTQDAHQTRRIVLFSGLVLGLNRDGSLTVWSRRTREYLATFYLLGPRDWIAVTAEGRYVTSPGLRASRYLSPRQDGSISDSRLTL